MPIDPSIALSVKPIGDLTAGVTRGINNSATLQNTANQAAANPGIQADSDIKQRAAKFNAWQLANAKDFVKPDGSQDIDKMVAAATRDGYYQEAQQLAGGDLTNKGKAAVNATTNQDRAIAADAFTRAAINHAAVIMGATPPEERSNLLGHMTTWMNGQLPGSGDQVNNILTKTDPKTGLPVVQDSHIDAVKMGTKTPLEQSTLEINQADQAKNFASVGFSPEGKDPNSAVSAAARAQIEKATGSPVDPKLSLFQMNQIPGYAQYMQQAQTATIAPTSTRSAGVANAASGTAIAQQYQQAIEGLSGLNKDVLATKLGTVGGSLWEKYIAQNPQLAGLSTMIQVHNNQFPNDPIDPVRLTTAEMLAKLKAGQAQVNAQVTGARTVAGTAQLPVNAPGAPAPAAPTAAPAAAVKMIDPKTMKVYNIPADKVDQAARENGLKRVSAQ